MAAGGPGRAYDLQIKVRATLAPRLTPVRARPRARPSGDAAHSAWLPLAAHDDWRHDRRQDVAACAVRRRRLQRERARHNRYRLQDQGAAAPPLALHCLASARCPLRTHATPRAQTIDLDGKKIKLQIWDTAGQVRRAGPSARALGVSSSCSPRAGPSLCVASLTQARPLHGRSASARSRKLTTAAPWASFSSTCADHSNPETGGPQTPPHPCSSPAQPSEPPGAGCDEHQDVEQYSQLGAQHRGQRTADREQNPHR